MGIIREQFEENKGKLPTVEPRELALYEHYYEVLADWNERMALVSRKSIALAFSIHFADSIFISDLSEPYVRGRVFDLGTGAGFPGICFAIRYPKHPVLLFERSEKKRRFLAAVMENLQLPNLQLGDEPKLETHQGLFFARAVMPREDLLPYLLPRLANDSCLVTSLGGEKKDLAVPREFLKLAEREYTLPLEQGNRRIEILKKVPRGTK